MPKMPKLPKMNTGILTSYAKKENCPDPQTLSNLDKIFLLLCEQNLKDCFNVLCYDLGIRSLDDLDKLDDNALKRFRLIPNFAKDRLKQLSTTVQQHDFVDLALKYGKLPYKKKLQYSGVPFIPLENIHVVKKVTSGPVSGTICDALLTKPDGQKVKPTDVRVCLRYDRSQAQRKDFLHEAEILAKLEHENILHLYGVVLPGLYTDSIGLVLDYCVYGNINEGMSKLSVHGLIQITGQLASALQYLESKRLVHLRLSPISIFLMEKNKMKLGGMWGCYPKDQIPFSSGRLGFNEITTSEVVVWFGQVGKGLFRHLEVEKFGVMSTSSLQGKKILCPDPLNSLFDQCCSKNIKSRPSFNKIVETLSTFALPKLLATSDIARESPSDLSCAKGDIILLISKAFPLETDSSREKWLGENKYGFIGLFDPAKTQEVLDVDDINWDIQVEEENEEEKNRDSLSAETDKKKELTVPPEIQARGVEAEHAFQNALKKGKVSVYRGRVMLVGQNRAGKTSLKKSLLGLTFDPGEPSTEGVEVDPSKFEVDVDRVMNWQVVKNEKFTSEFAEDIARLVVGELRSPEQGEKPQSHSRMPNLSEEKVQTSPVQVAERVMRGEQEEAVQATSSSSETDLADNFGPSGLPPESDFNLEIETSESVPEDVISLVAKYLQSQQEEQTSGVRETVVTIWDFAGQHLYYASHPVFLSPRAVYVLVYNMSKDLNAKMEPCVRQGVHDFIPHSSGGETNLDSILSWLVSVHNLSPEIIRAQDQKQDNDQPYLRPPVIIVGTHVDRPFDDPKRMEILIKKNLTGKSYEQHVRRPFFRVDNTRSVDEGGINRLRQEIREVLNLEPYMGEDVPVRWFNFEKVVEALVQQKAFYLKVAQLFNIVRKICFIEDESEMAAMLDFYHDLGIIIWHGDTVVLETQWLINLFRKLITIRPFDEQNPRHAAAWNELEQTGLLSMDLVSHVFAEFLCDGQSQSDILGMMEMYGLIATFATNGAPDSSHQQPAVKYFVPAQLGSYPQTDVDMSPTDICPLFINFPDGFLPHGLFPHLVCRFIRTCRELGCKDEPNLFQNLVRFIIGKSDLFLICKQSFIKVVVREVSQSEAAIDQTEIASVVRERLELILRSLSCDFSCLRSMRYEFCVACPSCRTQNRVCTKHRVPSCNDDGCIHFLPITPERTLICTKTFGDQSRVEIPGVGKWRGDAYKVKAPCILPDLVLHEGIQGKKADETDAPAEVMPRPHVFISYQWDLQDTVMMLKSKLEECGLQCWMDINRMGGGDSMYAEIDAGIRAAKVVICCVTKRYCQSEMCQREVTLADNLRKPIIPLLFEFIEWPPAGQLALIFTKLLYIDMTEGSGILPETKLQQLVVKVQGHVGQ